MISSLAIQLLLLVLVTFTITAAASGNQTNTDTMRVHGNILADKNNKYRTEYDGYSGISPTERLVFGLHRYYFDA